MTIDESITQITGQSRDEIVAATSRTCQQLATLVTENDDHPLVTVAAFATFLGVYLSACEEAGGVPVSRAAASLAQAIVLAADNASTAPKPFPTIGLTSTTEEGVA